MTEVHEELISKPQFIDVDELENNLVFVSLTDLKVYVIDFFEEGKVILTDNEVFQILNNISIDFFVQIVDEDLGYLSNSLLYLRTLKIKEDRALDFLTRLYNHFTFIVDSYRSSKNLDYLDKVTCEVISSDIMTLHYDPKTKK